MARVRATTATLLHQLSGAGPPHRESYPIAG